MSYRKLFLGIGLLLLSALACSLFSKSSLKTSPTQTSQPLLYDLDEALTLAVQTIYASTKTTIEIVPATDMPIATSIKPPYNGTIISGEIAGEHHVAMSETLSCIGRGYGVLPASIADANGIELLSELKAGQVLLIPRVQWINISSGRICPPQFQPPFLSLIATVVPENGDEHSNDIENPPQDGSQTEQPSGKWKPWEPPEPPETEDPFATGLPPEDPIEIPPIILPGQPPLPPFPPPIFP